MAIYPNIGLTQTIYPFPASLPASEAFEVYLGEQSVPVWVADGNKSIASFAFADSLTVRVKPQFAFDRVSIHPLAYGIKAETLITGEVQFRLHDHQKSKVVVRFDGDRKKELFVFGDPPLEDIPEADQVIAPGTHQEGDIAKTGVVVFQAGAHYFEDFELSLGCNHSVYLEPGAVLWTRILIEERVTNTKLIGRGVIIPNFAGNGQHKIYIKGSGKQNIELRDFILTNNNWPGDNPNLPQLFPAAHQIVFFGGENNSHFHVENVKEIANYTTSDGINVNGVSHVVIKNNFIANGDNGIVIGANGLCENYHILNNVIHQIGGSSTSAIFPQGRIENAGEAKLRNLLIENLYVIDTWGGLFGTGFGNTFEQLANFRMENAWVESDFLCQQNAFCDQSQFIDLKSGPTPTLPSDLYFKNIHWLRDSLGQIEVAMPNWQIGLSDIFYEGKRIEDITDAGISTLDAGSSILLDNNTGSALPSGWQASSFGEGISLAAFESQGNFSLATTEVLDPDTLQAFGLVYSPLEGDGFFQANLSSTVDSGYAGIMLRNDLAEDAPFAFLGLDPTQTLVIQYRDSSGSKVQQRIFENLATPLGLRLHREGSTLYGEYSTDMLTWDSLDLGLDLALRYQVLAGLVSNAQASFSHVEVQTQSLFSDQGQSPLNCGTVLTLPGRIQAEAFDQGGQGIAYWDQDLGNSLGEFRSSEDVEIQATNDSIGTYEVLMEEGEWLEYGVDVQAGSYSLDLRIATDTNSSLSLYLDQEALRTLTLTSTQGVWTTLSIEDLPLPQTGLNQRLRIEAEGSLRLNFFEVYEPNRNIPFGQRFRIKSAANHKYVNVVRRDNILYAVDDTTVSGQAFQVEDAGQGLIALWSERREAYVSNWQLDNPPTLRAQAPRIDLWEFATWQDNGDGTFSLFYNINHRYASIDTQRVRNPLICDKDSIGLTEKFYWIAYDEADNVDLTTSLAPALDNPQIQLYPNPLQGETLHIKSLTLPFDQLNIYDLQGRVVHSRTLDAPQTQLEFQPQLMPGLYQVILHQGAELRFMKKLFIP